MLRSRRFAATLAALVLPAAALAACASSHDTMSAANDVTLGPNGRAETRLVVPAGGDATVDLVNRGPGRADFVVKAQHGRPLAHGPLTQAKVMLDRAEAETTYVVVVESYADQGASVDLSLRVDRAIHGAGLHSWRVTR